LIALFLFQGWGEVVTRHVMYLQQTHQYNSNQLVALLISVTLLLFILILYFLAFDLARPAELHAYLRDILAITLVLVGHGRALYLMAHH
jgi:formate-dependent nitrite reductase membrane component NrfD